MPLTFVKISQLATALFLAGIEAGVLDTKGLPYIHEPFPDWRAREAGATSCALYVHTTPRPDVPQNQEHQEAVCKKSAQGTAECARCAQNQQRY